MLLSKLAPLAVLLLLSPAIWAESGEVPAKQPEKNPALERLEHIHQILSASARRVVQNETGGTSAQRAFLLARLDRMRVVVEDNALCGDEGFPIHYSEVNNQIMVCPKTAEADKPEQVRALARGLALSLSPCHAGGWLLKAGVLEKLESGDSSPLASCSESEPERHALAAGLLKAAHAGQTAFPQTLEWAKALNECQLLDTSPYHPLDGPGRFYDLPFGDQVAKAVDAMETTAVLELLLEAKDKPASVWNWPACQEEALDAFSNQLAEELLK